MELKQLQRAQEEARLRSDREHGLALEKIDAKVRRLVEGKDTMILNLGRALEESEGRRGALEAALADINSKLGLG
jgi:hypothetical protein